MKAWIPAAVCAALAAGGTGWLTFGTSVDRQIATYATPLQGRMRSQRHNAELCLKRLNGTIIPPHSVFSFNKVVGSWSRDQGYRKAPVSYNGQLISSWGGGVCQTSTTLYNVALLSGMVILERHPHRFSPSYVPPGRDAAVAFSSVDLRFVNPYEFPVRIEGGIEADRLVLSLWGSGKSVGVRLSQDIQEVKTPREYAIHGGTSGYARIRNTGKTGYDVVTWRLMDGRKELVSQDSYPAMQRIVEYR